MPKVETSLNPLRGENNKNSSSYNQTHVSKMIGKNIRNKRDASISNHNRRVVKKLIRVQPIYNQTIDIKSGINYYHPSNYSKLNLNHYKYVDKNVEYLGQPSNAPRNYHRKRVIIKKKRKNSNVEYTAQTSNKRRKVIVTKKRVIPTTVRGSFVPSLHEQTKYTDRIIPTRRFRVRKIKHTLNPISENFINSEPKDELKNSISSEENLTENNIPETTTFDNSDEIDSDFNKVEVSEDDEEYTEEEEEDEEDDIDDQYEDEEEEEVPRQNLPDYEPFFPELSESLDAPILLLKTTILSSIELQTKTVVQSKLRTYTFVVTRVNGDEQIVTSTTEVKPHTKTIVVTEPMTRYTTLTLLDLDATETLPYIPLTVNPSMESSKQPEIQEEQARSLDEARYNLATRIMSNGVEVIVAGDKSTLPGEPDVKRVLPTSIYKPITLKPSTLTNNMMMALPQDVSNIESLSSSLYPNQFVTKTCLTTFTYMTTYLENGTTTVSSHEQVVSNIATEERNSGKILPTPTMGITLTQYPNLSVGTFLTTYTYLNTILDGEQPIVVTSKRVVTNTVTAPDDYLSIFQPNDKVSAVKDTNTYYSTIALQKTLYEGKISKVISTNEVVTQVVITESAPQKGTSVMTSYIALDETEPQMKEYSTTDVVKTYFVTYTYFNTIVDDGKTIVNTNISTSSDVVTEKLYLNPKKSRVNSKSVINTAPISKEVNKKKNKLDIDHNFNIYVTKTYLTTFTYYTTLLQEENNGTSTIVSSHSRVVENIKTETIQPSLLDKKYLNSLKKEIKEHGKGITKVATLKDGQKIEITAVPNETIKPTKVLPIEKTQMPETIKASPSIESSKPNVVTGSTIIFVDEFDDPFAQATKNTPSLTKISKSQSKNALNSLLSSEIVKNPQQSSANKRKNPTKRTKPTVAPSKVETSAKNVSTKIAKPSSPVSNLLGSINIQALKPVLNAMAGLIQTNLKANRRNDSVSTTTPKVEDDLDIQNRSPIYIPVGGLADIETAESQNLGNIWKEEGEKQQAVLGKPTYESPLLNGGIPISPGEVITANSDVIVGKPGRIGPRIPTIPLRHPDLATAHPQEIPLGMKPPPVPNKAWPKRHSDQPSISNVPIIHAPNKNDYIGPPPPLKTPIRPQNVVRGEKHKVVDYRHIPINSYESEERVTNYNKYISHVASNKKEKRPIEDIEYVPNNKMLHNNLLVSLQPSILNEPMVLPEVIERSTGQPLLVNIQPSQVAFVNIPHNRTTALIYGGSTEPHINGQYFDDPSPYPEPEFSATEDLNNGVPKITSIYNGQFNQKEVGGVIKVGTYPINVQPVESKQADIRPSKPITLNLANGVPVDSHINVHAPPISFGMVQQGNDYNAHIINHEDKLQYDNFKYNSPSLSYDVRFNDNPPKHQNNQGAVHNLNIFNVDQQHEQSPKQQNIQGHMYGSNIFNIDQHYRHPTQQQNVRGQLPGPNLFKVDQHHEHLPSQPHIHGQVNNPGIHNNNQQTKEQNSHVQMPSPNIFNVDQRHQYKKPPDIIPINDVKIEGIKPPLPSTSNIYNIHNYIRKPDPIPVKDVNYNRQNTVRVNTNINISPSKESTQHQIFQRPFRQRPRPENNIQNLPNVMVPPPLPASKPFRYPITIPIHNMSSLPDRNSNGNSQINVFKKQHPHSFEVYQDNKNILFDNSDDIGDHREDDLENEAGEVIQESNSRPLVPGQIPIEVLIASRNNTSETTTRRVSTSSTTRKPMTTKSLQYNYIPHENEVANFMPNIKQPRPFNNPVVRPENQVSNQINHKENNLIVQSGNSNVYSSQQNLSTSTKRTETTKILNYNSVQRLRPNNQFTSRPKVTSLPLDTRRITTKRPASINIGTQTEEPFKLRNITKVTNVFNFGSQDIPKTNRRKTTATTSTTMTTARTTTDKPEITTNRLELNIGEVNINLTTAPVDMEIMKPPPLLPAIPQSTTERNHVPISTYKPRIEEVVGMTPPPLLTTSKRPVFAVNMSPPPPPPITIYNATATRRPALSLEMIPPTLKKPSYSLEIDPPTTKSPNFMFELPPTTPVTHSRKPITRRPFLRRTTINTTTIPTTTRKQFYWQRPVPPINYEDVIRNRTTARPKTTMNTFSENTTSEPIESYIDKNTNPALTSQQSDSPATESTSSTTSTTTSIKEDLKTTEEIQNKVPSLESSLGDIHEVTLGSHHNNKEIFKYTPILPTGTVETVELEITPKIRPTKVHYNEDTGIAPQVHHSGNEVKIIDDSTSTHRRRVVTSIFKRPLRKESKVVLPTRYITHTKTSTVTITKTTVVKSLGAPPSTLTILITKTEKLTIVDTVTEFHTLVKPTTIAETVTVSQTSSLYPLDNTYGNYPIKPTEVASSEVKPTIIVEGVSDDLEDFIIKDSDPIKPQKEEDHDTDSFFVVMTDKNQGSVIKIPKIKESDNRETQHRDEMLSNNEVNRVLLGGILIASPPSLETNLVSDRCNPECKASRNELCQKSEGIMRCACRPGFARMFPDRPCKPTYTYTMKIALERHGKERLHYEDALSDTSTPEFIKLASATHDGLDRMVMQSDLRDIYHGVSVQGYQPINNSDGVINTFHLQLSDNTDETRLKEVFKKYLRNNNYSLGGTELYASKEIKEALEANDFDECSNSQYHDCSEYAHCFNLRGTYTCSCKEGYADLSENILYPGRICSSELIGCEKCHYHGTCYSRGDDQVLCECFQWYAGDSCQVNLKVLLIALVTLGAILLLLLIICIVITCARRKPDSHVMNGMSFLPQRVPPNRRATIDRRAMIQDTSSESGHSDSNTLPYVAKKPKKLKGALKKPKASCPVAEVVSGGDNTLTYSDHQKDRSLTVMIPRAKYHPAPPTSPHNLTSFDKRKNSVASSNEAKLLSYLDAGPSPNKVDQRKYSKTNESYRDAPGSRKTSGALISAGFEVSATVGMNNMGTLGTIATTCGTEADRSENATLIQKISADLLSSTGTQSQFNTLPKSIADTDEGELENWLDITPRIQTISESRSYDETTIQPPTKSFRNDYDSKSSQHHLDEANTMAERDLGSTFLLPHTHLYKPDRGSDISGFESL